MPTPLAASGPATRDPDLQALLAQAAKPTPGLANEHQPGDGALMALLPKELQGEDTSLPPAPAHAPTAPAVAPAAQDPDANKLYADMLPQAERARIVANVQKMQAQGAPDDHIEQYLSGVEGLSKRADIGPDREWMGPVATFAKNVLPFNLAETIGSGIDATADKIGDAVAGEDHGSWMEKYRAYRDLTNDLDSGFQAAHPILHGAAKVGASLPYASVLAEMVPAAWVGRGLVNKAVASGAGGLAMQSADNFADAGGSFRNRLDAVARENPAAGFAGGVAGAVVAPALRGIRDIVAPPVARQALEQLEQVAARDLPEGASVPAALASRANEFAAANKPARLFDVGGNNLRDRAASVANAPGRGKTEMFDAIEARKDAEPTRFLADLQQHSGASTDNAYTTGDQLQQAQAARAKPLYDAAVQQPVSAKVQDEVDRLRAVFPEIDKAFGKSAMLRTRDEAIGAGPAPVVSPQLAAANKSLADAVRLNPGMPPEKIAFIAKQLGADPASLRQDASGMTVGDVHYAKRALDDMLHPKFQSANSIPPSEAYQANTAFRRLLAQVEQEVPAYRVARTTYKGDAEAREALELGRTIMDPENIRNPEEIQAAVAQMTPNERALFKQGAYDAIRRKAGDVNYSRSVANSVIGNPNRSAAIRPMFDQDADYQAFVKKLGLEKTMRGNSDKFLGSRTTPMAADMNEMQAGIKKQDLARFAWSPRRAGRTIAGKLAGNSERNDLEVLTTEIARLTNTPVGTPEFTAVMRALSRLPQQAAQRDAVNLGTAASFGGSATHLALPSRRHQ